MASPRSFPRSRVRVHPAGVWATAALLLAAFGATFVLHPGRSAPRYDPAYYTWRTDVAAHGDPTYLVDAQGPYGMLSGGYRIGEPLIGASLEHAAGVSPG